MEAVEAVAREVIAEIEAGKGSVVEMPNRHFHRCQNCGVIWGHGNMMAGDVEAHSCPKCGKQEWRKFAGFQEKSPAAFRVNRGPDWVHLAIYGCIAAGLVLVLRSVLAGSAVGTA